MGVLKKTIGISSKKSLKVFRPRRSLGRLVQGGALDARKKTRGSDQPWPPAPYLFCRMNVQIPLGTARVEKKFWTKTDLFPKKCKIGFRFFLLPRINCRSIHPSIKSQNLLERTSRLSARPILQEINVLMLKIKSYHPFGTLIAAMLAMLMHAVPRYEDPFLAMLERHAPEEGSIQVIGAGQGTTGTHSMYFEMCAMKFRSVHFNMFCNVHHATPMPEFLRLVRPTDYAGVRDARGKVETRQRSHTPTATGCFTPCGCCKTSP